MTPSEVFDGIGKKIITQELNGDIVVAELVDIRSQDGVTLSAVVVKEGGRNVVWTTQWHQAVFA